MKLDSICAGLGAMTLACVGAAPAEAAVVAVTYSGTIANGYDYSGMFGAAGTSLTGAAFTAVFTYDDEVGNYAHVSADSSSTFGGTNQGPNEPSPSISSVFTVNGRSVSVGTENHGSYQSYGYDSFSGQFSSVQEYDSGSDGYSQTSLNAYAYKYEAAVPGSSRVAFDLPIDSSFFIGGGFRSDAYDYRTGRQTVFATADLTPARLTIGAPGAVPEPGTWGMMILGFGVIGGAMRRRTAKVSVRFA